MSIDGGESSGSAHLCHTRIRRSCCFPDLGAGPVLLDGQYNIPSQVSTPMSTPQTGMSEADLIHEANRKLWLQRAKTARR